jgi:hypothetical protein
MSWEATAWASAMIARAPVRDMTAQQKLILMFVADRENRDKKYCFISVATLASDLNCSEETVRTAFRAFEAAGILARIRQVRANGSEGAAITVLFIDQERRAVAEDMGWSVPAPVAIDAPPAAAEAAEDAPIAPGDDPESDGTPPKIWGVGDPPEIGEGPSKIWGGVTLNLQELTSSPLPPGVAKDGTAEAPSSRRPVRCAETDRDTEGADRFLALWPAKTAMDAPEAIRRRWAVLLPEDRKEALRGIEPYCARRRAERLRPVSAVVYLRDRAWQVVGVLKAGAKDGTAMAVPVFVRKDTPAFEAWTAHLAKADPSIRQRGLFASWSAEHRAFGTWRASLFPPNQGASDA